jgi:hypothetical protein
MRIVNGRNLNFFSFDIVPNVKFGPVTDWENSYVFAFVDFTVKSIPQFWALTLWIPLAKLVTYRKDTFLSSRFFLVSTSTTDAGIKFILFDNF